MTPDSRSPDVVGGPRGSLFLGSAGALRRDQLGVYEQAMHTYGDIARFRIGPPRIGFLFDAVFHPAGAHEALASDARSYNKQVPAVSEIARLFGNGLLTTEGERWRLHRRIVQPLFTRAAVASYVDAMAQEATRVVLDWKPSAETGRDIDLYDSSVRYALRVLGRSLLGGDVDEGIPILRETLSLLNPYATRRALSPIRLPTWLPTSANRRATRAQEQLFGFVDEVIARRRRSQADGDDLLSRLIEARDSESGAALDERSIRDEAMIFLVAGHETSASALASILYLLGQSEEAQHSVREEADRVVGNRAIEPGDLERLVVTETVINEGMRMYPPVHTLVRRAERDTELLGHSIPAGRIVAVSIWGIHHAPAIWSDPEHFRPERYSDAVKPYTHLPFGGGPRACIGRNLALAELMVAVTIIVRAYHLATAKEPPAMDAGVTLRPAGPLSCRVTPVASGAVDGHRPSGM